MTSALFGEIVGSHQPLADLGWCRLERANEVLQTQHYLGSVNGGVAWMNRHGVIALANPRSRRLPQDTWFELIRWCIVERTKNVGSQQWALLVRALRAKFPTVTTIISYSDPSQGHTGALYRACNWWWAPTWHRLRPPPTGNGEWTEGEQQSVKDRWVYPLRRDSERASLLTIRDDAILKRYPWAVYREPGGVPFHHFKDAAK